MITLTTPSAVKSVLGSATTVNYDKLVISPVTYDAINQIVTGTIRMTSTVDTNMQAITGTLRITVSGDMVIEVPQLGFFRRIVMTAPMNSATIANLATAQNAAETGLINVSVVAGVQTAGV